MTPCGFGPGCQALDTFRFALGPVAARLADGAVAVQGAQPLFWPLSAAAVGAVAASLGGVFADRYPRMAGWRGDPDPSLGLARPPSRCDGCGERIPPLALVPVVGWLLSEGRCAHCAGEVPREYPLVEAATALVSMLVVAALGATAAALGGCLLLWALVPVAWVDWREHAIPDCATVPLFLAGLLASPFEADAWSRGAGGAVAMGSFWLAFRLVGMARDGDEDLMSLGDVALGGAMGAWVGLCALPTYLLLSVACYLAYALPLRLLSGRVMVPMGPGLAAGAMLATVGGALLGHWP